MVLATVYSVNNVPIRLTDERWEHVVERRPHLEAYYYNVLDAVERPTYVLPGHNGALIAVLIAGGLGICMSFIEKLVLKDGFIVTAYITRRANKRRAIWREEDQ